MPPKIHTHTGDSDKSISFLLACNRGVSSIQCTPSTHHHGMQQCSPHQLLGGLPRVEGVLPDTPLHHKLELAPDSRPLQPHTRSTDFSALLPKITDSELLSSLLSTKFCNAKLGDPKLRNLFHCTFWKSVQRDVDS